MSMDFSVTVNGLLRQLLPTYPFIHFVSQLQQLKHLNFCSYPLISSTLYSFKIATQEIIFNFPRLRDPWKIHSTTKTPAINHQDIREAWKTFESLHTAPLNIYRHLSKVYAFNLLSASVVLMLPVLVSIWRQDWHLIG